MREVVVIENLAESSAQSEVKSTADIPSRAVFKVDLDRLTAFADVGVRRASAFLKLGLRSLSEPALTDLTLNGDASYSFWPNPLPEAIWDTVAAEYKVWLVGSCLKELDQFFSLFLDEASLSLDLIALHGGTLRTTDPIPVDWKFAKKTNSAKKYALVAARLGLETAAACLSSLSAARNALTHGMGKVRSRDLSAEGILVVEWEAWVPFLKDGPIEMTLLDAIENSHTVRASEGAEAYVRRVNRSKSFSLGQKIDLSADDLAEICMFYRQISYLIRSRIIQHAGEKGIAVEVKS